jgi:hypothetical protein
MNIWNSIVTWWENSWLMDYIHGGEFDRHEAEWTRQYLSTESIRHKTTVDTPHLDNDNTITINEIHDEGH